MAVQEFGGWLAMYSLNPPLKKGSLN